LTVAGLLRIVLGAVLFATAAAKLRTGAKGRDALRSYGIASARARGALWAAMILVEAALGIAVAAGARGAAEGAAALLALFAVGLVVAIGRGRAGSPCGCFGGRSRIGWAAVARTTALAVAFAAVPILPGTKLSTDAWLATGLVVALVAVAGLAVAVFALARELGELRLAVAPQSALSLEDEGPPLGSRLELIERFERSAPLAVAVFTSPGCALCRALEPSLRLVASDPEVEVELFDEEADVDVWRALEIPGSPYALVLSADGDLLAKGTFNSLYQLESLLVHATRPVGA
jgi:hypothetical protein